MTENLPSGLVHVMEVYRLVRLSHHKRIKAVNEVARVHRIDPNTVSAACTRSLGIPMAEFDDFLDSESSDAFCEHLVRRFPPYQKEIEAVFDKLDGKERQSLDDPTAVVRTLFPDEKKDLIRLLLLDGIRKKFTAWLDRRDIPEDVRQEMADIKKQIDKA
ncbi:MAG: hypothetical protein ABSE95_04550 [Thermodesulfobacteriota bacterium]|jgi:hypothetical protein